MLVIKQIPLKEFCCNLNCPDYCQRLLYISILDPQQICVACCLHLDAQQFIYLQEGLAILSSSAKIRMNAPFLLSPLYSACQCCDSMLLWQYLGYWMKKCVSRSLLPSASVNIGLLFRITLPMEFVEPFLGWRELSIFFMMWLLQPFEHLSSKKKNGILKTKQRSLS